MCAKSLFLLYVEILFVCYYTHLCFQIPSPAMTLFICSTPSSVRISLFWAWASLIPVTALITAGLQAPKSRALLANTWAKRKSWASWASSAPVKGREPKNLSAWAASWVWRRANLPKEMRAFSVTQRWVPWASGSARTVSTAATEVATSD